MGDVATELRNRVLEFYYEAKGANRPPQSDDVAKALHLGIDEASSAIKYWSQRNFLRITSHVLPTNDPHEYYGAEITAYGIDHVESQQHLQSASGTHGIRIPGESDVQIEDSKFGGQGTAIDPEASKQAAQHSTIGHQPPPAASREPASHIALVAATFFAAGLGGIIAILVTQAANNPWAPLLLVLLGLMLVFGAYGLLAPYAGWPLPIPTPETFSRYRLGAFIFCGLVLLWVLLVWQHERTATPAQVTATSQNGAASPSSITPKAASLHMISEDVGVTTINGQRRLYANIHYMNDGGDAEVGTYQSSALAEASSTGVQTRIVSVVREHALSHPLVGATAFVPIRAQEVHWTTVLSPPLSNGDLLKFLEGKTDFYFDALMIVKDSNGQTTIDFCGINRGNPKVIFDCPIGN